MSRHKYIFVLGGVMSGVGKGVTTSSIGKILQARGFKVSPIKIDPYLNVDAGTMNPIEHGEVFVLDSGLECDQDMGNYERFLGYSIPPENYMTSGMVYKYVIEKERALGYGGKCVDPVPYISEEILRRIRLSVEKTKADITVVEIGGTVGEYQNSIFIEAARILKLRQPPDVLFVLVSYLPVPRKIGEMKTKPTQYAVRTMNSYGVHPDIIIARSVQPLDRQRKEKIALATNVAMASIISAPDVENIYEIPINFEADDLSSTLLRRLGLRPRQRDLKDWQRLLERSRRARSTLTVAVAGKYFKTGDFVLADVYLSVLEALKHAAGFLRQRLNLVWLDVEEYERGGARLEQLDQFGGILIPGGFGERGVPGKLKIIERARERRLPYFGICYGMQLAVVEYARHVLGWRGAHSTEINPETRYPVVDLMSSQKEHLSRERFGGTMRLGAYPAWLKKGTLAAKIYGQPNISERHRHRFEINSRLVPELERAGLVFSGVSPDGRLMELVELPRRTHPFFVGTQFHPEFKSTPLKPHPLFVAFLRACLAHQRAGVKAKK